MKTPICDFLSEYAKSGTVRMHMPGHKGVGEIELRDITEIRGADSLFEADGIIRESESYASMLFGADTYYSTEGSSLAIRAMLTLATVGKSRKILAARGAHKVLVLTAAMLDLDIEWLSSPTDTYLSASVTPELLHAKLGEMEELPSLVYITSPDYLGNIADIAALAEVSHSFGVPLLVDAAHGAYTRFLTPSLFPTDLGADMAASSAHKTLPTLTGGAYLHISRSYPIPEWRARWALSLYASTSPSYLILSSLDKTNAYLEDYPAKLSTFVCNIKLAKERLISHGYKLFGNEPLKITVYAPSVGATGYELADYLRRGGVECEMADPDYLVLMPSEIGGSEALAYVTDLLLSYERREKNATRPPHRNEAVRKISIREAILSPSELTPVREALDRVAAGSPVSCPPAIPIVIPGEVIDESAILAAEYYSVTHFATVKE